MPLTRNMFKPMAKTVGRGNFSDLHISKTTLPVIMKPDILQRLFTQNLSDDVDGQ